MQIFKFLRLSHVIFIGVYLILYTCANVRLIYPCIDCYFDCIRIHVYVDLYIRYGNYDSHWLYTRISKIRIPLLFDRLFVL